MSDNDEEEFDGEKTQIFLPGGKLPKRAPRQNDSTDTHAEATPAGGGTPSSADSTEVDFDITTGSDAGGKTDVEPQTTQPRPTHTVQSTPVSSSGPSWIVIFAMLAVIAYLIFR